MWLDDAHQMISLWPSDTSDLRASELSNKRSIGVDVIQQLNTIDRQSAHPSFVYGTYVTVFSSDICTDQLKKHLLTDLDEFLQKILT